MDLLGEDEILCIFQYLDPKSLITAGRVCREWYQLSKSNSAWREHCMKRWSFCNLSTIEPCTDIWYKYFSARMRIDHKLESGRPGLDYKAKSIRFHKNEVLGVIYITSPKSYTKDLIQNHIPDPLIASWDRSNIAVWMLYNAKKLWAAELDAFESRKALYDNHNDQIIYTSKKGIISVVTASNGIEVTKLSTNNMELEISAIELVDLPANSELYKQGDKQCLFVALHSGLCQVWSLKSLSNPKFNFYSLSMTDCLAVSSSGLVASTSKTFSEIRIHDYLTFSDSTENENIRTIQIGQRRNNDIEFNMVMDVPFLSHHIYRLSWLWKSKHFLVVSTHNEVMIFEMSNGSRTNFSCKINGAEVATWEDKILVGDRDGKLSVYTISEQGDQLGHQYYLDHNGPITGIHADSYRVLTCSTDLSIRVYKWGPEQENVGSLVSLYTLLGGSMQFNPEGFRGLVCDYGSCVGWTNNVLKSYIFIN